MKCNCSCVFDWTGLDYKWIPQLLRFHRDIKHTCYMILVFQRLYCRMHCVKWSIDLIFKTSSLIWNKKRLWIRRKNRQDPELEKKNIFIYRSSDM